MDLVERLAQTLYGRWLVRYEVVTEAAMNGPHPAWNSLSEGGKRLWLNDARAVLETLSGSAELERVARRAAVAEALEAWAPHISSGYTCPAAAQTMLEAALLLSGRSA